MIVPLPVIMSYMVRANWGVRGRCVPNRTKHVGRFSSRLALCVSTYDGKGDILRCQVTKHSTAAAGEICRDFSRPQRTFAVPNAMGIFRGSRGQTRRARDSNHSCPTGHVYRNVEREIHMKRSAILTTAAVLAGLGISLPVLAVDTPATTGQKPVSGSQPAAAKPAEACMSAVRSFTAEMSKQGYWMGGSDYGYGYPIEGYGYGYGYGMMGAGRPIGPDTRYGTARPGYEIRTLVASANILAKSGNQQACDGVLASARTIYTRYAADLKDRGLSLTDRPGWRQREIAAAQPVTAKDTSVRYDQLLDADVVSPGDLALGSVQDLVTDPQTGKIAYVVISRGGLFGIDVSHTPVPWSAFRISSNGSLLVLDATKAVLAAAPQGRSAQFTKPGQFDAESQKVQAYWSAHLKLAAE